MKMSDSVKARTIIKEGTLFKQRNHFKGWRSRWFCLDTNFLHYYLERDNMASRNSIQIESGTIVVTETSVKIANDVAYYPFLISHAQSSLVFRLSTTSREDRDSWVAALNSVITKSAISLRQGDKKELQTPGYIYSPSERESFSVDRNDSVVISDVEKQRSSSSSGGKRQISSSSGREQQSAVEQPDLTVTNIPVGYRDQLEKNVITLLECASASASDPAWQPLFQKKGVVAYVRAQDSTGASSSSGDQPSCVKGVTVMPYTIEEIYSLTSSPERRVELDSNIASYRRVKWFSRNTGVEYLQFKTVWPTAARDFCNLTHWRVLADGTLVSVGMCGRFEDLCPEDSSFVRGRVLCAGYVFRAVPGGTSVTIMVQSDLGGTLPPSIRSLAAQSQPYILSTIRAMLDKTLGSDASRRALSPSEVPRPVTYEDILNLISKHQKGYKIDSESGGEDNTQSSTGDSSETVQRLTQQNFVSALDQRKQSISADVKTDAGALNDLDPLLPDVMRKNIPHYCAAKLELLINQLIEDASSTAEDKWAFMSDKRDIKAYTKINGCSGAAFYVKGETFFPYSVPEICSAYFRNENRLILDSQMATYTRLRWMSLHVGYEYMQFKPAWPTTARDSCNITTWRVLNNGTFVDLGFDDSIQPEDDNFVRAKLKLGGYVLTPVPGGTRAVIVVHSELGGSLPNSICQLASQHQPSTLHKLRILLGKMYDNDPTRKSLSQVPSPRQLYDDLVVVAQRFGNVDPDTTVSKSTADKSLKPAPPSAPQSRLTGGGVSAVSRARLVKRIDWISLIFFSLPALDFSWGVFSGHSSVFQYLVSVSSVLAAYVYVMYFDALRSWVFQKHVGKVKEEVCQNAYLSLPSGAELYHFNINMAGIEECLKELQEGQGSRVTASHIVIKALGVALADKPNLRGVVFGDQLFRQLAGAVDVSVSETSEAGEQSTKTFHKVENVAAAVSIGTIASETMESDRKKALAVSMIMIFLRLIRFFLPTFIFDILSAHISGVILIFLVTLGVDVCPYGVAHVISLLSAGNTNGNNTDALSSKSAVVVGQSDISTSSGSEMDDKEVDFSVLPMSSTTSRSGSRLPLCLPSLTVTLGYGGVKFIPVQNHEKKIVRKFTVLNVSVCLHEVLTSSPGCSLQEKQEFISKLKSLLNNPKQLNV